jgi:hypothetical protein
MVTPQLLTIIIKTYKCGDERVRDKNEGWRRR